MSSTSSSAERVSAPAATCEHPDTARRVRLDARRLWSVAVLAVYTLIALGMAWPLPRYLGSRLIFPGERWIQQWDPMIFLWDLWWMIVPTAEHG